MFLKWPNASTARLIRDPQLWPETDIWEWYYRCIKNYSMQKYYRKTKEDYSQKSASGHNLWSLFNLAVETLGLLMRRGWCVRSAAWTPTSFACRRWSSPTSPPSTRTSQASWPSKDSHTKVWRNINFTKLMF